MRIAVTGREGQVVRSLLERARERAEVIALGRPVLDLARPETIMPVLSGARPDIVVSAAAYTAVDQAEDEPELAFTVNAIGAGAVAEAAARLGVPIIHLSTDYVFHGEKGEPYSEEDAPNPKNVYGASKLAGEKAVAAANPDHIILRTAWVYSPFGKNFVKTMLALAQTRDHLRVVSDQYGNPSAAHDIADAVMAIAEKWHRRPERHPRGIYHFAGWGYTSWHGFAREVFALSRAAGGPYAEIEPITTAEYPTKAVRPQNSRLDCGRFSTDFGYSAPNWRDSLEAVVKRLLSETT